ncbi:hypothetical protein HGRIS_011441 [Hohenbuehelia grisea]|uniref:Glucanase n=1 Tax=Hohenbuehelia grisea TaxID=104357 RepID=A0ABR3JW62_9AGAR
MFRRILVLFSVFSAVVHAQQVSVLAPETHPLLTIYKCTTCGGCQPQTRSVVLDASWRSAHRVTTNEVCLSGNTWNRIVCIDPVLCAKVCAVDSADYAGQYGITTSGNSLRLRYVTHHAEGTNVGSRVFLLESDNKYQKFSLKNREFAFDVDASQLPCGLKSSLSFTEMDADGGSSKFPDNKAGAKFGTGYCDAQCPHEVKWQNGEANLLDWFPTSVDTRAWRGKYGACCTEVNLWEANQHSAAYTAYPCIQKARCDNVIDCGDWHDRYNSFCDKDGCDYNSHRLNDKTLFGSGKAIDTTKKITVITQFITHDNTPTGNLVEIRRIYRQNGIVIQNSRVNIPGVPPHDSLTDGFCSAQKSAFGDRNYFEEMGGLSRVGRVMDDGLVLGMSILDDPERHLLWLDGTFPPDRDSSEPGVVRGTCSLTSGNPTDLEAESPNASVTFSNIRYGDIGSTYPTRSGCGC